MRKLLSFLLLFCLLASSLSVGSAEPADSAYKVGEIIPFGHYDQDDHPENGKEPILWVVLSVEGHAVEMMSMYGFGQHIYDSSKTPGITWKTSMIRQMLNTEFFADAFTADEQQRILTTTIVTKQMNQNKAIETEDKVYLLDISEVRELPEALRICQNTPYAQKALSGRFWWLRDGHSVNVHGNFVGRSPEAELDWYACIGTGKDCIRPVIRILDMSIADLLSENAQMKQTVASLEAALDATGAELSTAQASLTFSEAEKERMKERMDRLEDSLAAAEAELAVAQDAFARTEAELAATTEAKAALEAELTAAAEAKAALEAELANTQTELAATTEAKAALEAELAATAEAKAALEAELAATTEAKAALEAELTATAEAKAALEAELAATAEAKAALEAELAATQATLAGTETKLHATETALSEALEALEAAKTSRYDFSNYRIGNVVTFGNYEQDNYLNNGPEQIKWVVVSVKDDRMLLLSLKALDAQPYDAQGREVTWLDCSLRTWLNGEFLTAAFTEEEQALLYQGKPFNNEYYAENDRVFLLDYDGAVSSIGGFGLGDLFIPENHRSNSVYREIQQFKEAPATAFALSRPGSRADKLYWTCTGGAKIFDNAFWASRDSDEILGVRPAIWVTLP